MSEKNKRRAVPTKLPCGPTEEFTKKKDSFARKVEAADKKDGTCELVIYCYECKNHYQLNSEMIAISLLTKQSIWKLYEYILTTRCRICNKYSAEFPK